QQGRTEDAIRYYSQACRIDDRSVPQTVRLVSTLIAAGRLPDAEKAIRRLLDKLPENPEAWNALGFVLKLRNHMSAAAACHQRAVTLNPKFIEGWTHYGLTMGLMGRNYQALQYHEQALA